MADSSAACTSGNPPPRISPVVPAGRSSSCKGSKATTRAPAAARSSACSVYPNVKAAPPAMATTGGGASKGGTTAAGSQAGAARSGARRARVSRASRSQEAAIRSPSWVIAWAATAVRSAAGIRPRWRDGVVIASVRLIAPRTAIPDSVSACLSSRSCRSDPTRFKITPATSIRWSKAAKPAARAATERPVLAASMTSSTGAPSSRATCAVEPKPGSWPGTVTGSAPSNRPITPSMTAT